MPKMCPHPQHYAQRMGGSAFASIARSPSSAAAKALPRASTTAGSRSSSKPTGAPTCAPCRTISAIATPGIPCTTRAWPVVGSKDCGSSCARAPPLWGTPGKNVDDVVYICPLPRREPGCRHCLGREAMAATSSSDSCSEISSHLCRASSIAARRAASSPSRRW
jgi:hypothetical protein